MMVGCAVAQSHLWLRRSSKQKALLGVDNVKDVKDARMKLHSIVQSTYTCSTIDKDKDSGVYLYQN